MKNNQELLVHPDVILLVVHLVTPVDNGRPLLPLLAHKLAARKRRRSASDHYTSNYYHKRRRHGGVVVQGGKGVLLRKPLTSSSENYTQVIKTLIAYRDSDAYICKQKRITLTFVPMPTVCYSADTVSSLYSRYLLRMLLPYLLSPT